MRRKHTDIQNAPDTRSPRVGHSGKEGFLTHASPQVPWAGQVSKKSQPLILAVDNDPASRADVIAHLSGDGVMVEIADNETCVLERLEETPVPDLVLLDLGLPAKNASEICSRIREIHSPSELPIILVASRYQADELIDCMALGANDYLIKPYEKEELKARINAQLRLRQAFLAALGSGAKGRKIAGQRKQDAALKTEQRKLSDMMHAIEDALLVVNPDREIAFVNRACTDLLNIPSRTLLGQSIFSLFENPDDPALDLLAGCFDAVAPPYPSLEGMVMKTGEGAGFSVGITLGPMAMAGKNHCFLILKKYRKKSRLTTGLIGKGLTENSLTCNSLTGNSLAGKSLPGNSLPGNDLMPAALEGRTDKRQLLVRIMNLSVILWSNTTGTGRIELAERSGLWNVYTNQDGWARTQTMDKYLDFALLPRRPKFGTVVRTAEFVLAASPGINTVLRRELQDTLNQLRRIC